MKLINLPIDLLQVFNPRDENFTELKADAEHYENELDKKYHLALNEGKEVGWGLKVQKAIFDYNKNWFVRIVCGFLFIFFKKWITDALRDSEPDEEEEFEDLTDEEKYEQFLQWRKFNKM